jgi:hypothetical protein
LLSSTHWKSGRVIDGRQMKKLLSPAAPFYLWTGAKIEATTDFFIRRKITRHFFSF